MPLFDNAHEANLRACAQMVEEVLQARGLDLALVRMTSDAGPAWNFHHGSADILIFLTPVAGSHNTIQVIAPVLRATPLAIANGVLSRRLLELNCSSLMQAAFGMRENDVLLSTDRSTQGLDAVEVEEMIRRLADYADHYDDALVAEFGGTRSCDLLP